MKDVCLLITIIQRAHTDEFLRFFGEEFPGAVYSTPCAGTAHSRTLDLLGIEKTDKSMLFAVMTGDRARDVLRAMTVRMQIDLPDRGVGLSVPLSSIGGSAAMEAMLGQDARLSEREGTDMSDYELIVAIIEKGHTDDVMNAARQAGAGGGTVIRAKGTGAEKATKFLGVSIAEEKEMIFIVTRSAQKNDIMRGIMRDAGIDSRAHTLLFSIPVSDTAGFRLSEIVGEDH